jgi:hypothetical protein
MKKILTKKLRCLRWAGFTHHSDVKSTHRGLTASPLRRALEVDPDGKKLIRKTSARG